MLKIIKKLFLISLLLASNCFGMDMLLNAAVADVLHARATPDAIVYSALSSSDGAPSSTAHDIANDRFNTWSINTHTGMQTTHNTAMDCAASATSVKAIQQAYHAYSLDIQKAEIASVIQVRMQELGNLSLAQINQKIAEMRNHLAAMNYQKNDILSKSSIPSMHISQVDGKTCSDGLTKIASLEPTAQQKLDAQQKLYHDALILKKIEIQIAAYEKILESYEQQQAHLQAKLLEEFKSTIDNVATKMLIEIEVPKLQQEIATIQSQLTKYQNDLKLQLESYKDNQKKIIELESTLQYRLNLKKSETEALTANQKNLEIRIQKINHEISLRESALYNAKIKLNYLESSIGLRLMEQRFADICETQALFTRFCTKDQLSIEDQEILTAVNTATYDQCDAKYQVTTMLDKYSQKWLVRFGIDLKKFEKRIGVDALQTHLLNEVIFKLNEVASMYVRGATDAQVKKYMDAMVAAYTHTVDVVRTGTPQEAIAAFKASGVLQKIALTSLTVLPDAQVDIVLTSTTELAHISLNASKLGHINSSLTISEVASGIVDCVATFRRVTDSEHSLALVQGAKTGVELGIKSAAEAGAQLILHPIESLENICKTMVKAASILGEIDQLNSQTLDKAQMEAIVKNANKLACTLNEAVKDINTMSSVQIAGKIGEVIGQTATETLIVNKAFKAINAAVTLSVKKAESVLGKLGATEHAVVTQKALATACQDLSTAVNTKTAEIAKEIQVAKPLDYGHSAIQYEQLKGALSKEQFTSVIKCSQHGVERLVERGFNPSEIRDLMNIPDIIKIQSDGAKVFIKTINDNKYNLMIYNEKTEQLITALRGVSKESLTKLGSNYGWNL